MLTPILTMALAAAPLPASLKPSGPWTVEFAEKLCGLGRMYDAPKGSVMLAVKAPLVGRAFEIILARPGGAATAVTWHEAYIIKPGGARVGPFPLQTFTSVVKKRVARFSIDAEKYTLAEDGGTLTLDLGPEGTFSFAVPNLPKALATLENCTKGLRKAFDIDQQIIDRVAVLPKSIAQAFEGGDYPQDALRQGLQGTVGVLAFVGTDGRLTGCKVIESSGTPSLDHQTCAVLQRRARYQPALDAQGTKMRAPIYTRIRWLLPGR